MSTSSHPAGVAQATQAPRLSPPRPRQVEDKGDGGSSPVGGGPANWFHSLCEAEAGQWPKRPHPVTCLSGAWGGSEPPGCEVKDWGNRAQQKQMHTPERFRGGGAVSRGPLRATVLPSQAQQEAQPRHWGVGRLGHRSEKLLVPVGTRHSVSGWRIPNSSRVGHQVNKEARFLFAEPQAGHLSPWGTPAVLCGAARGRFWRWGADSGGGRGWGWGVRERQRRGTRRPGSGGHLSPGGSPRKLFTKALGRKMVTLAEGSLQGVDESRG